MGRKRKDHSAEDQGQQTAQTELPLPAAEGEGNGQVEGQAEDQGQGNGKVEAQAEDQGQGTPGKPRHKAQGLTITKAEAARRVLAETPNIKPADAVDHIRETYHIDMTPQHFSLYKSKHAKKGDNGQETAPRPARSVSQPAPRPAGPPAAGGIGAAMRVLQEMVSELGSAEVKALVDHVATRMGREPF